VNDDPFLALGLTARAGLSDEEVRAAWRRIAAATHPDLDDGGDPARFGAAAAAYALLRTADERREALADLASGPARVTAARAGPAGLPRHRRRAPARAARAVVRAGGVRLLWRVVAAGTASGAVVIVAGWSPGTVGVLIGIGTWLAAARLPPGRRDRSG
jgi:hypothetical protein